MTNSEDRRTMRTQKKLKTALLTLLKEKDLNRLSITEVTQQAGCNRVTFYSHYKDLQELLAAIVDDYLEELQAYFRKSFQYLERFSSSDAERHLPIFEFLYQNQRISSLVIKGEVLPGSQNQFCDSLFQVSEQSLRLEEASDVEVPALNYFMTYGSLGFFLHWINEDFKEEPLAMAKKLAALHGKMYGGAVVIEE
ncbi:transcriptional regulator, TetR family protein [Planococcus glaciei]|uniref:TetR/AcrR family transcriptional regulator n=1 Tax=Planococcus glaciei TaxID=459472 RepID=UPI00069EA1A7|nr:TetR/AcrR family transcriptional regulator [Planococcus glaciei]KOF11951.1 transcriptional regulator, TetR family protein [Planococcus glaciei]